MVVDTGLMFPTAEMLGIDLVLPDFSYLREPRRRHRGDRPHPRPRGPRRRAAVRPARDRPSAACPDLRRRADDRPGALEARGAQDPRRAARGARSRGRGLELGPFELEMIHMAHSIPDSCAVVLRTELGPILITGDYKFDQTPVDGNPADVSRLAELGRRGPAVPVRRLDQRRSARRRAVGVERRARPCWTCSRAAEGRIIVTSFASNVHRVQQVIDAAAAARPPGGPRGPLDAQELQHRLEPWDRRRSGRAADPAAGDRVVPRPQGGRDLHRKPGRAAVRAAAHGPRRPPRRRAPLRATR